MLKASKEFEEARNQRFFEKEKVYGGDDNRKNYKNMTCMDFIYRIVDQANILLTCDKERRKKELIDTANLCELAWQKLR